MTDAPGPRDERTFRALGFGTASARRRSPESLSPAAALKGLPFPARPEFERQASYFLTGGLAAVHASGRDRSAIWDALQQREVYATSGPKMLLWFDLLNAPDGGAPMGSEVVTDEVPWFRVRAVGALEQKPGCPDYVTGALSAERLQWLCRGECDNPGEHRHVITRVEIVRIRPQTRPDEPVDALIEDPWLSLSCDGGADGCVIDFRDPEFPKLGREVLYYARAIQEPTPAVNAAADRCEYDESGRCVRAQPCYGDYRTPSEDDCLSPNEERAWSSPIYLRPPG